MASEIQYIDVTIPGDDDGATAKKEILARLRPAWSPERIITKVFTGGYINFMTRFHEAGDEEKADAVIMRCYREGFQAGWHCHDNELEAMQVAHHAGCFPPLLATFNNGLVYKYAPGRMLEGPEIIEPAIARLIARCLAQFHLVDVDTLPLVNHLGQKVTFPRITSFGRCFQQIDNVLQADLQPAIKEKLEALRPRFEEWRQELTYMMNVFDDLGMTWGLCHQDVHARNIIYNEQEGSISLVDYEACAFGFVAFDLSYIFDIYVHKDYYPDFPLMDRPVSPESRLIYATSYLERKYELQGRDPADLSEDEIEVLLLEVQLMDIAMPLFWLVLESSVVGADSCAFFSMTDSFTEMYYERKRDLKPLCDEYKRRKARIAT